MAKKGVLTKADYLPYAEYRDILERLREDGNVFDELYFVLAFSTALRGNDLLSLKWKDILDKGYVFKVEQKTGKTRRLKFTPETMSRIKFLYEKMGKPDPDWYVFRSTKTGSHVTLQRINQRLKDLRDRYNVSITNFSSHTFRKTFGRYVWESNGRSDAAIAKLCIIFNHSSTEITMRYIGIRDEEVDEVYDSICL